MTKPTGRPRGRPKTKEYVTLMARVSQDLADRVKVYRSHKRQTMSDVLRDGLELLLEQEHEQAPLYVYDRKGGKSSMMSDTKEEGADIMSDRKDAMTVNMSDTKEESTGRLRRARSAKVSDTKGDRVAITSDTKADVPTMVSDTKEAQTAGTPEPAILSDRNIPTFDPSKYCLGKLCPRAHEHGTTGQSLLKISNRHCPACDREKWHEKGSAQRQAKHQAPPAASPAAPVPARRAARKAQRV
jgi:hypothetical protein